MSDSSGPSAELTDPHRRPQYRFRFGTAEFDEARFELRVGGLVVDVQQKPLQLLDLLIAAPGETLDKDAILEHIWGNRATGDAILNNAASKLRGALGSQNGERIVTVPRRGYRFDGPVERIVVGRRIESRIRFEAGDPSPGRNSYRLARLLSVSAGNEIWLIRHPKSGDQRVMKFALHDEQLANLKREVTILKMLRDSIGERQRFVRVLDWNFEHQPFWIETEYAGRNLDSWAEEVVNESPRLATIPREQRIAFLLQIVDAVASVHDAGVLHKDLKPTNILVDEAPGGWRVRLADFGSGRILDPERLKALQITRLGLTVSSDGAFDSGTLLYLAPELLAGEPPSTRSDLFALGIIAYQLLATDLKRPIAPGWERDIDDELLRQDLARATDVDPLRRFASVAEFAAQLRALPDRHEQQKRVLAAAERDARDHLALSQARARRPWLIALVAVLAVGTLVALTLFVRERRATRAWVREYQASVALNRLLREDIIAAANPAVKGRADITVAQALAQAAAQIDGKFADQAPLVRGRLHGAMQSALSELSRSAEAVEEGQRALAAYGTADKANLDEVQEVRLRLAVDLVQVSKLDEAGKIVQLIEQDAARIAPLSDDFRARLLYAKSWVTSGDFALQESTVLMEGARKIVQPMSQAQAPWRDKILFGLADNYTMLGRNAEGERLYRALYEDQVQRLGAAHPRPLYTKVGLARSVMNQHRNSEARQLLQDAVNGLTTVMGPQHRMTLSARDSLADVHFREGDYSGAAAQWRIVHDGFSALMGIGSSYAITVETTYATALQYGNHTAQAEPVFRQALARARAIVPNDSPQVQQIRYALADCLLDLKQLKDVEALLSGLTADRINLAQQETNWSALLGFQRGRLALARGEFAKARQLLESAAPDLAPDGHASQAAVKKLLVKLH